MLSSAIGESLTYPGVGGFAILAFVGGVAAFERIDRATIPVVCLYWATVPLLYGGFLFTNTSSLPLAAIGTLTLWLFPGLGCLLIGFYLLFASTDMYHWLSPGA